MTELLRIYFDLKKEICQDFTKTHMLSLVIDANRKFGWSEFDPSQDAKTISAIQSIKNWSSNSNKLISTIGKYISEAPKEELDEDDPLYSGIIDSENIENQKPCLFQKISNLDEWKQIKEIGLPKKMKPFTLQNIKAWFEEKEYEVERDCKRLVHDIKREINLINESTFTHNILPFIIKLISPGFFKRWDQAQNLSAKDREVSYGPFYKDPDPHIDDDKKK
ncbi:hypothetical protein C2G38_2216015 [Gigaspora rosea]|uniref:Uncharacterized protein n=1 Tax=Gigaspora rosea TaxID=44941 RepID=A0A397UCS3_9GLOM|nr:hypothetical protein C2G38_2216015 [Gigaspora rosea]